MKKHIKKFIESMAISMSGAVSGIALLLGMLYIFQPLYLSDFIQNIGYDISIDRASNDDYVYMISKLCNLNEDDEDKIYCVYNFYIDLYNYEYQKKINSIEYNLINSTDCKNSMVFYCAVFEKMNMTCKPTQIDGHVWATVQFEDGYCNVDQSLVDCH